MNLSLRFEGEEHAAILELDSHGCPKKLWLIEPARAPLPLCERVELLSKLMDQPDGWACVRALAPSSPRFAGLVERIAERICGQSPVPESGESLADA